MLSFTLKAASAASFWPDGSAMHCTENSMYIQRQIS